MPLLIPEITFDWPMIFFIFVSLGLIYISYGILFQKSRWWNYLQKNYPAKAKIQGETFFGTPYYFLWNKLSSLSFQTSGSFPSQTISVTVGIDGIFMEFQSPMNIFASPILLPWSEIEKIEEKEENILRGKKSIAIIVSDFSEIIKLHWENVSRSISEAYIKFGR